MSVPCYFERLGCLYIWKLKQRVDGYIFLYALRIGVGMLLVERKNFMVIGMYDSSMLHRTDLGAKKMWSDVKNCRINWDKNNNTNI